MACKKCMDFWMTLLVIALVMIVVASFAKDDAVN